MSGTEYFDKIVVRTLVIGDGGKLVSPASGVDGLVTAVSGQKPVIASTPTAPTNTAGSAGATYTSAEQTIINALVTQVNALSLALKNAGHLK